MGMPKGQPARSRLAPADWASAALVALAAGGLAAVAVEPLAAGLGATKGSFYWHFRDRAALIDAALELWVQKDTDAVIDRLNEIPEPKERLRALFAYTHPAVGSFALEAVMLAEAGDPQVGPVLHRVTHRRVSYLAETLRELGLPKAAARYRALFAYQAWIGQVQLQRAVGDVMPSRQARTAYLQHVLTILEAGLDGPSPDRNSGDAKATKRRRRKI